MTYFPQHIELKVMQISLSKDRGKKYPTFFIRTITLSEVVSFKLITVINYFLTI